MKVNTNYLYLPESAKSPLSKSHFVDKTMGFQTIEHGTALPYKKYVEGRPSRQWGYGGIVDGQGNFVPSYINGSTDTSYTPPSNQFSIALKLSFILASFFIIGVTL